MLWTDNQTTGTLEHKAAAYAGDAFDVALALEPIHPSGLPFYILDRYRLWRGDLFGRACVFMAPDPEEARKGLGEIARHRATVCNQLHADLVVLLFEALPPRQRRKLIADRIAFMVPGAQLFVPEMLLEFREGRLAKPKTTRVPDKLSPTAQMVAIAALLGRAVEGENATALARKLGVAAMSMIRAFDELQAAGVADARRVGRERSLHLTAEGHDLWSRVERLLQSPVRKVRHVRIPYPDRFPGLIAGESALAHHTALASPRTQTLAVAGADWNRIVREHGLEDSPDDGEGDDVQTWTYDPAVFAEHMTVDRLSLYLSVRDHADERVAQAAEQLLESMPW
jgi:hypothetical protein